MPILITYDELVEIYGRHGHTIRQPNSVKAIAEALNTISKRILLDVATRFVNYETALRQLGDAVLALERRMDAGPGRRSTPMQTTTCYCGSVIYPGEKSCEVCHAKVR